MSALLRQTAQDYSFGVGQARASGAAQSGFLKNLIPSQQKSLASIVGGQQQNEADIFNRVAGLGPSAGPYAGSIASEAQASDARLRDTAASTVRELGNRGVDAQAGTAAAVSALGNRYLSDRARIGEQLAGLGQQKGAVTAKAYQDALTAARQQDITLHGQGLTYKAAKARTATTIRGQNLSHQDRQASLAARNKNKGKGTGQKPLTPGQADKLVAQVGEAKTWIDRLSQNPKLSSHQIRQMLETGQKLKSGNQTTTVPKIPHDLVNAAYDVHVFGSLSHPNRVALHRLGVPRNRIPPGWLRPPRQSGVQGLVNTATRAVRGL